MRAILLSLDHVAKDAMSRLKRLTCLIEPLVAESVTSRFFRYSGLRF